MYSIFSLESQFVVSAGAHSREQARTLHRTHEQTQSHTPSKLDDFVLGHIDLKVLKHAYRVTEEESTLARSYFINW